MSIIFNKEKTDPTADETGFKDMIDNEGVVLVPRPTSDPLDPLNWHQCKKYLILAIVCLAAFAGIASSLANQLAFEVQGKLYRKSLVEMSYSSSAAVAGIAFGPLFFVPLARMIGRCSTIWWSLVGAMACNIWAASMTNPNQYIPFVISGLFAGLQGLALTLVFFFLEETGFSRDGGPAYPTRPESFAANRAATFFWLRSATAPFAIGLSPVTLLAGTFQLLSFGWFVMINTLLTVFLQEPEKLGGYGFTPQRNADFTLCLWVGIIFAQIYGHYLNGWLPLKLSRRNGGLWKPEYRLHTLWLPSLILLPIGLGIFGVALQYHPHYMVLALGAFIVTISAMLSVPVAVIYVVECFRQRELETSAIMGTYRLAFGLAIPFFIDPWEKAVGIGWVFGMAAFFSIGSFMLLVVLMWKGRQARKMCFDGVASSEEGSRVTESGNPKS
ncbi:hypothetical protein MMC28_009569 [Mycoblastus sanguinarius]|nr:hypothetical protein [Mycoblastus sanguinarius]